MFWKSRLKPDDPEKREKLKDQLEREGGLEKHDMLAMILSALAVFLPAALGVLLLLVLVCGLPIWLA